MFTKLFGKEKLSVKQSVEGYYIGNNFVKKIETIGCTIDDIMLKEFEKSDLHWLVNANFRADKIVFIGQDRVDTFIGEWFSGDFEQGKFVGKFFSGKMKGDFLTGEFYEAPENLFGSNLSSQPFEKYPNYSFEGELLKDNHYATIASIPKGYHITFQDSRGEFYAFQLVHFLEEPYKPIIIKKKTHSQDRLELKWSDVRSMGDNVLLLDAWDRENPTELFKTIFHELKIPIKIKKMWISKKYDRVFYDPKIKYEFDLKHFDFLGYSSGVGSPTIHINIPSKDAVSVVQNTIEQLNDNMLEDVLVKIKHSIRFNIIKNALAHQYLGHIINNNASSGNVPAEDKKNLLWLEEFVRNIVLNIVKNENGAWVENKELQDDIFQKIKDYIYS
jgi:hypothetical protein